LESKRFLAFLIPSGDAFNDRLEIAKTPFHNLKTREIFESVANPHFQKSLCNT